MNKSFTLIEILVVIVVIGVLSAFILVGTSSITNSANIAKSKAFSESLRNSLLTSLVSEWKLDGNTNDSWGANNGTWYGAGGGSNLTANWRPESECVSGQCLHFDGTDDYVLINYNNISTAYTGSRTISVWVKPEPLESGMTYGHVVGQMGWHREIRFNQNKSFSMLEWYPAGTTVFASTPIIDFNKWYYLVGIWNKENLTISIYLNGLSSESNSASSDIHYSLQNIYIGGITATWLFKGTIDQLEIYKTAFSASQIKQSYFLGLSNLYKNRGIAKKEYIERITELKYNLAKQ